MAPVERVIIRDPSINCGGLDGRAAILLGIRDDEDGYVYRVRVTETRRESEDFGLVLINGVYETWVRNIETQC